jgi:hypothetical protein
MLWNGIFLVLPFGSNSLFSCPGSTLLARLTVTHRALLGGSRYVEEPVREAIAGLW